MPTIQANGITINYRFDGPSDASADLVVLINGLSDEMSTWDPQVPALVSKGFEVLRYDNRGIGGSSKPSGPYDAEIMADDLQGLLLALDLHRGFHLVGMSMGGMIAQAYAIKYPNHPSSTASPNDDHGQLRMLSLSLCCTYAAPGEFCSRMFAFWADVAARMGVAAVMRDVTLWCFTVPFFTTRTAELEEFEAGMSGLALLGMNTEHYLSQLNVIQVFDSRPQLKALKQQGKMLGGLGEGEIMILAGQEDILIPVSLSRELCDLVDGAEWVTTRGGHGCQWEFPDETNDSLVKFLDRRRGGM